MNIHKISLSHLICFCWEPRLPYQGKTIVTLTFRRYLLDFCHKLIKAYQSKTQVLWSQLKHILFAQRGFWPHVGERGTPRGRASSTEIHCEYVRMILKKANVWEIVYVRRMESEGTACSGPERQLCFQTMALSKTFVNEKWKNIRRQIIVSSFFCRQFCSFIFLWIFLVLLWFKNKFAPNSPEEITVL